MGNENYRRSSVLRSFDIAVALSRACAIRRHRRPARSCSSCSRSSQCSQQLQTAQNAAVAGPASEYQSITGSRGMQNS